MQITPTDAARVLRVSRPTVYKMIREGRLGPVDRVSEKKQYVDAANVDAAAGAPNTTAMLHALALELGELAAEAGRQNDHDARYALSWAATQAKRLCTDRTLWHTALVTIDSNVRRWGQPHASAAALTIIEIILTPQP